MPAGLPATPPAQTVSSAAEPPTAPPSAHGLAGAAGRSPRRPVRVCLVTGEYPPDEGGVADYTACLAADLAAQGAAVDVLTARRDGRPTGVDVDPHDVPGAATAGRGFPDAAPAAFGQVTAHRALGGWGWGALIAVGRLVDRCRPDVVHVQYQAAAFGMRPAIHALPWFLRLTRPRVRLAVTYHDLRVPYLFPKAGPFRAAAVRLLARSSHLIVATNGADFDELAAHRFPGRLDLVPIGSNIPDAPPDGYDRAAWRAAAGFGPTTAVLAYFGFLNTSKGGRDLAQALAELRAAGRDARLVMIGGAVGASDPTNAGYLADFRRDLASLGDDDAVHWTGHVAPAAVSAWLHAADVVVLPYTDGASYRRGSLLAALSHGRPIVTTAGPASHRSGPLPPLVDGESARLVAPGDPTALAAAVAAVLDDPWLAERLVAGARIVAASFGWGAIAARHVELYRDILGPRQADGG